METEIIKYIEEEVIDKTLFFSLVHSYHGGKIKQNGQENFYSRLDLIPLVKEYLSKLISGYPGGWLWLIITVYAYGDLGSIPSVKQFIIPSNP